MNMANCEKHLQGPIRIYDLFRTHKYPMSLPVQERAHSPSRPLMSNSYRTFTDDSRCFPYKVETTAFRVIFILTV